MMNEKEFETYWQSNRKRLLDNDASYREAKNNYKMTSGADWLLYAIPVVSAIVVMDNCNITNELLKWAVGAAVCILCFVVCVWIKSLNSDGLSPDDIEKRIKKRLHDQLTDKQQ